MNLLLKRLENLYVLKNCSFDFSKFLWQFVLQSKHLYSKTSSVKFIYWRKVIILIFSSTSFTHFLSSCPNLHLIFWIPSERLLKRFDDEISIKLVLSINYNMQVIFSCNLFPIFINSGNFFFYWNFIDYAFSVFSPKQTNCFLNSSPNSFMIKW